MKAKSLLLSMIAILVVGCSTNELVSTTYVPTDDTFIQLTQELDQSQLEQTATLEPTISPVATTESGLNQEGDADVLFVEAEQLVDGSWNFIVTVEHPDIGWENYANGWDVVLPTGEVLKPDPSAKFTRTLLHPHVNEQPFTRSQNSIEIPDSIESVVVRAHDIVDGFGGKEITVDLTQSSGENYTVKRSP